MDSSLTHSPVEADAQPLRNPSEPIAGAPDERPPFGRTILRWTILAAGGFLFGLLLFNFILMPGILGHGNEVQVPDVVGRAFASAKQMIEREGLRIGPVGEQWNGVYPEGYVVGQTPGALSRVKRGREVRLVVSAGTEGQEVPDMTGVPYRDAQVALARTGLRVGRLAHAYSETVPKDAVLATDPEPGSRAEPGGRVDLLVSLGARAAAYLLPDLRGRPIADVRDFFGRSGIRLVERSREAFGARPGQVLEQSPPPGSRIRIGELVEVVVASAGRGTWQ